MANCVAALARAFTVTVLLGGAFVAHAEITAPAAVDAYCRKDQHRVLATLALDGWAGLAACHRERVAGRVAPGTDCGDTASVPSPKRIERSRANLVTRVGNSCDGNRRPPASDPVALGYDACPAPCDGVAIGNTYSGQAACLACLGESLVEDLAATVLGAPALPLTPDAARCQAKLASASANYLARRMAVQARCQYARDQGKVPLTTDCRTDDARGLVARARVRLADSLGRCSDAALAGLDSCATDTAGVRACVLAAVDGAADAIFAAVFPPIPDPPTPTPTPTQTATPTVTPTPTRTPTPEPCGDYNPLRNPYVGELHVHTAYSFDSILAGVSAGPRDMYEFARGEPLALPPFAPGYAERTTQLRRPLDFAAATDHAEFFGEFRVCTIPGYAGYDSDFCRRYRDQITVSQDASLLRPPGGPLPQVFIDIGLKLLQPAPTRFPLCGAGAADCIAEASLVWDDTRAAAEEYYERCTFTTFVAYEWTGNPAGANIHRNVIFRNDLVPALPTSYIEAPKPQQLWTALDQQCLQGLAGCDVLSIPHSSNFSAGLMFQPTNANGSPLTQADAAFRAAIEPLVEIHQHKGNSECKVGVLTNDEDCGFETYEKVGILDDPVPGIAVPPLSFVRNGLKEGLRQDELIGANPFQFGFVGAGDSHNATAGATNEADYRVTGHVGGLDWEPRRLLRFLPASGMESNGGGLAIVWAEENSREAIFDALKRREVYATSGTRPTLRFFGGWEIPADACDAGNPVAVADQSGVPMGGTLVAPPPAATAPQFFVAAQQDPGAPDEPGMPLERIQIVKGWVDAGGNAQEKVFDVAGGDLAADVDVATCATSGSGYASLCTVWTDPEFVAGQRAFYYARVFENPVCRWSTQLCNELGVDCSNPASVPADYAECCSAVIADQKVIQERAWSSPIWYRPETL